MKNPKGGSSQNQPKSSKDSTFEPFQVTAPEYSAEWMEEVDTLSLLQMLEERAQRRKKKA